MLEQALRRKPPELAIDLGSSNTRLFARGRGVVVDEPTVVAIQIGSRGREVVAVGREAREMFGRTPAGTEVVQPVRSGVVADFEATEELLRALMREAVGRSVLKPRVAVCVPPETTEVERRAVRESARAAGAREVALLPTAMAAAAGCGLPVTEPVGSMVVDIGGGRTEAAVVSLGGTVIYRSSRVAGDAMDAAIVTWLEREHNLVVGASTAEAVRRAVGRVGDSDPRHMRTVVRGRDTSSGGPSEQAVTSDDLAAALAAPAKAICDVVLSALGETPPELAADILDRGVMVCGGVSELPGVVGMLREATGLPVLQAEAPHGAVARGAALLLDDLELYQRVALGG